MKLSPTEAYQILGLENGASLDVVKSTYKQVALRTHPDKNPDNPDATAQFQRVSEAYNVLSKHLDPSPPRGPPRFRGFAGDSDEEDDYYDEYESDGYEGMDFYMFMFEQFMRSGGGRRYMNMNMRGFRREPVEAESPQQYQARLKRSREEQVAAEERRKQEAAARRARAEMDRERDRVAADERQKAKMEAKKAKVEAQRSKSEANARSLQQQAQAKRSAVFTAARAGKSAKVKSGVWEDGVDAAGGEVKAGCDAFVKVAPKDPQETLLHIAARNGDKELIEWLDSHSADPEERDSRNLTAFHIALQSGHVPIVAYFFQAYSPKDSDSEAVYRPPTPKTLLSIALESHEPELVWKILENGLATEQDINLSWTWITSAKGRSEMKKSAQGSKKGKGHDEERFGDIIKLLMRFGGFTPPPTPSSSDNSDGEEQWDQKEASQTQVPAQGASQARPSSEDQKSPRMEQQQKQASAGRGRGQGRGRGRGRGRGGAKS
ncbi:DnaJ domain-containing protein [Mycena alexandri]|uniref:DnaJ domain-containing protein n=1 Tax=Mycena alexandri TaxID=1745969 RepID=A0AAD6TMR2_9AGAR|nr:DnaJ domain-containing protein [Mycena alexandri]